MDTIEFHAVVGQDQVIRPPAGVELPRGEVEVTVRAAPSALTSQGTPHRPLAGSVLRDDDPFGPAVVAEDWEANR